MMNTITTEAPDLICLLIALIVSILSTWIFMLWHSHLALPIVVACRRQFALRHSNFPRMVHGTIIALWFSAINSFLQFRQRATPLDQTNYAWFRS